MIISLITLFILMASHTPAGAYTAEDFSWFPPSLLKSTIPSVTIVLDNSASMLGRAHDGPFIPGNTYAGFFDPQTYYTYRPDRHVAAFVPDNATGSWNGNFLNWAVATRLDIARKALTGGKFDSLSGCFEAIGPDLATQQLVYDDFIPVADTAGRTRFMTPYHETLVISSLPGQGSITVHTDGAKRQDLKLFLRITGTAGTGVLQYFRGKTRMAMFVFNGENGGRLLCPMGDAPENIQAIIDAVNTIETVPDAPLAEALHSVYGYLRQDDSIDETNGPRYAPGSHSYMPGIESDPYRTPSSEQTAPCTRQSVILITAGQSSKDRGIPPCLLGLAPRIRPDSEYELGNEGSAYLIDIAYAGHTSDLRPEAGMPGEQNWNVFTVAITDHENALLMDTARFGNFRDINGNHQPDLKEEYDLDADGFPDGYMQTEAGQGLGSALIRAFQLAIAPAASGSAFGSASEILAIQKKEKPDIIFQAISFPPSERASAPPPWSGQVHAYFVDAHGNLREDTDADGRMNPRKDRIIGMEGETMRAYADLNGDGAIDEYDPSPTKLDTVLDIRFPWSTSSWLNHLDDSEAGRQRNDYALAERARYIFTFADENGNMLPDPGEIQPFALPELPRQLGSPVQFYNYLTLYESRSGDLGLDLSRPVQRSIDSLRRTDPEGFRHFLATSAKRQVDFIRGVEVGNATICNIPDITRSRRYAGETWRLGDIANSAPVLVSRPAENYHLLYGDKSYESFVKKFQHRRRVVYVGANDGMLHAFNAGFGDGASFETRRGDVTPFPLGAELWAYIPFNLLPHLKWLMRPDYGERLHAAYMDLRPSVFDARIFFASDGITPSDNATHPDGWGTILVAGMRLGGARIVADIDKSDGDCRNTQLDRTLTSALVIMDITDPEHPPRLIAEIALPKQGFTTSRPAVMAMSGPDAARPEDNRWNLVFGSGPATLDGTADRTLLEDVTSEQPGRIFILDLNALISEHRVKTVTAESGNQGPFAVVEANSFLSAPVAVDLDIGTEVAPGTFKTDAVYFGTVAGTHAEPGGRIWRLGSDNIDPNRWHLSTLFKADQPISAAPTPSVDREGCLWLHFGTGRLFDNRDRTNAATLAFFGIRDKTFCGTPLPSTANASTLLNGGIGWRKDFLNAGERVLEQALVCGGRVIFVSSTHGASACDPQVTWRLWNLDATTGADLPVSASPGAIADPDAGQTQETSIAPRATPEEPNSFRAFFQAGQGIPTQGDATAPEQRRSRLVFWRTNSR